MHVIVNATGAYGLFRDEYYYIACANNLAAGYVDHPPLSAFILRFWILVFGDSLFATRLLPALCGGITVFITGLIAKELGGKKVAIVVACVSSMTLIGGAMFGFYSMNAFEFVFWAISGLLVLKLVKQPSPKLWIILGVILGLGLMNKIGLLFLGAGLFVGIVATKERKWFATPWPYIAGAIAFILFLPYIIWNLQHDLAHLEFIHNASSEKYKSLSPITFLQGQILINNPAALVVWVPGLIAFFVLDQLKPYRILAFLYIVPLVILLINKTSKSEYLAPAYTVLWASGGVWWEHLVQRYRYARYALIATAALWLIITAAVLPVVMPVLPVEKYIEYSESIGMKPESSEGKELSELPQFYADMFGWEEKAKSVAEVFHSLSEEDQKKCAIFSNNYGRCASLDYFAEKYKLPKTIGNHNNYWIWGPRNYTGEVVIILGGSLEDHRENFEEVVLGTTSDCQYCMPYEDNVKVFVCRGLTAPFASIWADEKHYD